MTTQELYESIGADYAEAKSRLMSDRIIGKFVVKFPKDPTYEELMTAWDSQDENAIFRASHTLKGVCANLALEPLRASASTITEAYRPGQEDTRDAANIPAVIERLKEDYAHTMEQIHQFEAQ